MYSPTNVHAVFVIKNIKLCTSHVLPCEDLNYYFSFRLIFRQVETVGKMWATLAQLLSAKKAKGKTSPRRTSDLGMGT